jgi:Uma2 family endonuclease
MSTLASSPPSVPAYEHVYLPGVSFATYESLVTEIEDRRRLRVTYHHGEMEIMSPTPDHERAKTLVGRMIEALTEELGIPVLSCGSTTFKDQLLDCGLEPDECYWVQNESAVRGRKIKIGDVPPPDLALEVDITTSVIDRFPIYAALGFPEIWQYVNGDIIIHLLQKTGHYVVAEQSAALPMVSVPKLVEHLDRCHESDETTWIRAFRKWVCAGMK